MKGSIAKKRMPVRGMILGYPKGGKTGSLAALLNVGYKVRLLNFEGMNYKSVVEFTEDRALDNLDILNFSDRSHMGQKWMEPLGDPKAFNEALRAMQEWKTVDQTGKPYSLGRSRDWGPDVVVVLDSMTRQGEAAYARMMKTLNRTPGTVQIRDWGFVVNDQLEMLRLMGSPDCQYHFLVLAHMQIISPESIVKDEEETNKQIKREIGEILASKLFPKAVTKPLSMHVAKEFPLVIQAKQEIIGNRTVRRLYTQGGQEVDLGMPVRNAKPYYPLETGLAEIFSAWGHQAPGFEKRGR